MLLIQPTSELAALTKHVHYFRRLPFIVCISRSLVGITMPILEVCVHQNFPAEAAKIISCKMPSLNSLWFNEQTIQGSSSQFS